MKTIHFFGDSWTRGDGCQFEPGSGVIPSFQKYGPDYTNEYNTFSYPSKIKLLLNDRVNIVNNATSGSSNFQIYRTILQTLYSNKFKKNDVAIIAWSSIIREPLNFLFTIQHQNNLWDAHKVNNSIKGFTEPKDRFLPAWIKQLKEPVSKELYEKIYEDYIVDRINLNLLYEICMNYVCNLQILFNEIGVKFIFINTFEQIISKDVFFYDKIEKNNWILFDSTLSDYLCDIEDGMDFSDGYSLWEDDLIKPGRNFDGPHPNRIGYQHIAELIHKELLNKNLI